MKAVGTAKNRDQTRKNAISNSAMTTKMTPHLVTDMKLS
jgi:hypothetical protein